MPSMNSHGSEDIRRQISARLTAYLHPNDVDKAITISDIVRPITDLLIHGRVNGGQLEEAVESLWNALIDKAESTSWDDPVQNRLVSVLEEIKRLPSPTEPAPQVWSLSLWSELPMFGANPIGVQWTNINAFAARLAAARVVDFSLYAIWAMRRALETPLYNIKRDEVKGTLQAAGVWLQLYGQQMHDSQQTWEPSAQRGNPAGGGPLYDGPSGFCDERWKLWQERLAAVEKEAPLEEHTQCILRDASTKMAAL